MALPTTPSETVESPYLKLDNSEFATFLATVTIEGYEEVIEIPPFHALNVQDQLAPTEVAKEEALKLWLKNHEYPSDMSGLTDIDKRRAMKGRMKVQLHVVDPNASTQ